MQGKAHSIARTCSGKPDPKGTPKQSPAKTAFEHTLKKRRPDAPKFCPYDIYL
ncbi:hypothetical protein M096_0136 [Parabacteroides distasonis str. 3999B T(B) 6]|nr:hypothetical protein M096_0136 [Parabacteroides distasonis str. 3999B T(B) 6]